MQKVVELIILAPISYHGHVCVSYKLPKYDDDDAMSTWTRIKISSQNNIIINNNNHNCYSVIILYCSVDIIS